MVELFTAVVDTLGAAAFLAASWYAYQNYQSTKAISDYWLVYMSATLLGAVWAGLTAVEKYGFYTSTIDQMVGAVVSAAATGFAIAALLTASSLVQPTE